jgi:hypothetical protein
MEAETALPVPRNPSMFSVNCVRSLGYCEPTAGGDDEKNGDARYALDLLSLCGRICEEEDRNHVTENDVRQAQRLADMMRVYCA